MNLRRYVKELNLISGNDYMIWSNFICSVNHFIIQVAKIAFLQLEEMPKELAVIFLSFIRGLFTGYVPLLTQKRNGVPLPKCLRLRRSGDSVLSLVGDTILKLHHKHEAS